MNCNVLPKRPALEAKNKIVASFTKNEEAILFRGAEWIALVFYRYHN